MLFDDAGFLRLRDAFAWLAQTVRDGAFSPNCVMKNGEPVEFAAIPLTVYSDYPDYTIQSFSSMSELLLYYYETKEAATRIRQKSAENALYRA